MKVDFFKKAAVIAIAVTMSVAAYSQSQGDKAVGGNLVIGHRSSNGYSWTNVGIGAKFYYNVTDPIRLAGEFDYFLKKDEVSMWDFSVYGHYLFPVADQVVVYPAIGLGIVGSKYHGEYDFGSNSDNDFGFSLGGGADYEISSNLSLNGELRIKLVNGYNWLNIAIGLAYKF